MGNLPGVEISDQSRRGIKSLAYGITAITGSLLKYFTVGATGVLGSAILGALSAYGMVKAGIDMYNSQLEENNEVAGSFFGKSLARASKAIATYGGIPLYNGIPWISAALSIGSGTASMYTGVERLEKNKYYPWDYPNIDEFKRTPPEVSENLMEEDEKS